MTIMQIVLDNDDKQDDDRRLKMAPAMTDDTQLTAMDIMLGIPIDVNRTTTNQLTADETVSKSTDFGWRTTTRRCKRRRKKTNKTKKTDDDATFSDAATTTVATPTGGPFDDTAANEVTDVNLPDLERLATFRRRIRY